MKRNPLRWLTFSRRSSSTTPENPWLVIGHESILSMH
jgi:hypothetical protein